ncbi:hypothetical protein ACERNI_11720 [Camelimonas sp. ID_303_24]
MIIVGKSNIARPTPNNAGNPVEATWRVTTGAGPRPADKPQRFKQEQLPNSTAENLNSSIYQRETRELQHKFWAVRDIGPRSHPRQQGRLAPPGPPDIQKMCFVSIY